MQDTAAASAAQPPPTGRMHRIATGTSVGLRMQSDVLAVTTLRFTFVFFTEKGWQLRMILCLIGKQID